MARPPAIPAGDLARAQRANACTDLLRFIAARGRNFFAHKGTVSSFAYDPKQQRVYFLDSFTGKYIYTHYRGRWQHFTQGGTLRALIEALRDFIMTGTPLRHGHHFGPWPDWYCDGDLWAYGAEPMEEIRAEAARLGIMKAPVPAAAGREPYEAHTKGCSAQAEESAIQGEEPVCVCMDRMAHGEGVGK